MAHHAAFSVVPVVSSNATKISVQGRAAAESSSSACSQSSSIARANARRTDVTSRTFYTSDVGNGFLAQRKFVVSRQTSSTTTPAPQFEITRAVQEDQTAEENLPAVFNARAKRVRKKMLEEQARLQGFDSGPLKVKFSQGKVVLSWSTQGEENNAGFILERKEENEDAFTELGSYTTNPALKGQGTTTRKTTYKFIDEKAVLGYRYAYKLSAVDTSNQVSPLGSAILVAKPGGEDEDEDDELPEVVQKAIIGVVALAVLGFLFSAFTAQGFKY